MVYLIKFNSFRITHALSHKNNNNLSQSTYISKNGRKLSAISVPIIIVTIIRQLRFNNAD